MKDFSATDAAIEGFMLAGRKPGAVLVWSAVQLAVNLLWGAVMVVLVGQDLQLLASSEAGAGWGETGPAMHMFAAMLRVQGLTMLFALAWGAVQSCAVYRALLRPQDKGWGYLKLGRDELRMVGLGLLYFLLWIAAYVGLVICLVIAIVVAGLIASGMDKGAGQTAIVVLVAMVGMIGPVMAIGWVLVRLSLSGPLTFVRGRIQLWSSWKLTRGHFWALSGAYLISLVLAVAVMVVGFCLALLVGFFITHQGLGGLYQMAVHPDTQSIAAFFSPERLIVLTCQALFLGLVMAIVYAPAAAAYRMLTDGAEPVATPAVTDEPAAPRGPWG